MKKILNGIFIYLVITLTACQTATPLSPVLITENIEFTLAPNQTASIASTGLSVKLIGVTSDERCPSEIECAASGPVTISLVIQIGDADSAKINLQTFTDNNGRAPDIEFEGIDNSVVHQGYLIRVTGVLPYPANLTNQIKDSEYRVSLVMSRQ